MFDYDPLWQTMEEKQISTYRLIKDYGFSKGTLNSLKQNKNVSMKTIDALCQMLQVPVERVVNVTVEDMALRAMTYQTRLADQTDATDASEEKNRE